MIKVTSEVPGYDNPAKGNLRVEAHWNDPALVVLVFGEQRLTVAAADIKAAVMNATNTNRH